MHAIRCQDQRDINKLVVLNIQLLKRLSGHETVATQLTQSLMAQQAVVILYGTQNSNQSVKEGQR